MDRPAPDVVVRRDDLWLPFLAELTEHVPEWAVWKNVESALAGRGDIDSFAPPGRWPTIEHRFTAWAERTGMGPVLVCRHIPQGPHFITVQRDSPYIVQLDVKTRGTFRGSTLIDADDLLSLSEVDERGFRRVRPGVEGVLKLCMNATMRGGVLNATALETKRVAELLDTDPRGVELGAELLGPAKGAARRGAAAVVAGTWDRRAMATVEAWSAARSLAEPRTALSRWWFLKAVAPRCPVIRLIRDDGRRVEGDPVEWIRDMAPGHELIELG